MKEQDKRESLFAVPNYPAWFGADTALLCGSAVHCITPLVYLGLGAATSRSGRAEPLSSVRRLTETS